MKNHFFKFDTEAAAMAALGNYVAIDDDGSRVWNPSIVIPDQRVIVARNPYQALPGYFVTVTLPDVVPALQALPGGACRLIGDSETGEIVWTAPDVPEDFLATAIIEPIPAGAAYYKAA